MQQDAVRKLGFTTDRTMRTAQQLFEGIDVGQGAVGLITYMRTDSVTLSEDALTEIHHYIENKIGADFLPNSPRVYKTKSKNAQEAHEAIRPTSVYRSPESVKPFLSPDQFKLYQMIWQRTMACQMVDAKFDATTVDIHMGEGVFRASGQVLVFAGFLSVYQEGQDEDDESEDAKKLPEMAAGDVLPVDKLYGEQHFTQPPPRFNEATLVKALEEFGIGRPSTYASIIKTLKDREYVIVEQRRFQPTDTGDIVNKFLTEHFEQYVDYDFTAKLEDQLDEIANGKRAWVPVMDKFWKGSTSRLKKKKASSAPNSPRRNWTKPAPNAANTSCKSNSAKLAASSPARAIPNAITRATSTKPPSRLPSAWNATRRRRPNWPDAAAPNAAASSCSKTAAPAANSSAAPIIRNANTSSRWKNRKTRA